MLCSHVAEALAVRVAERISAPRLARCDAGECCAREDEVCARELVTRLGRRAFRRPLREEEIAGLLELHRMGAEGASSPDEGFREGVTLVLTALLQAPSFIYFAERGGELDGYELATRLSYFLWNTMPDDALLDAAASRQLASQEGLLAQFDRLLGDARARRQIANFHETWLEMRNELRVFVRDTTRYPIMEDAERVRSSLERSFSRYVNFVILDADSLYATLILASLGFMGGDSPAQNADDPVARIYNIVLPPDHTFDMPVGIDPATRRGILTHPAYLAAQADEVRPNIPGARWCRCGMCCVSPSRRRPSE